MLNRLLNHIFNGVGIFPLIENPSHGHEETGLKTIGCCTPELRLEIVCDCNAKTLDAEAIDRQISTVTPDGRYNVAPDHLEHSPVFFACHNPIVAVAIHPWAWLPTPTCRTKGDCREVAPRPFPSSGTAVA